MKESKKNNSPSYKSKRLIDWTPDELRQFQQNIKEMQERNFQVQEAAKSIIPEIQKGNKLSRTLSKTAKRNKHFVSPFLMAQNLMPQPMSNTSNRNENSLPHFSDTSDRNKNMASAFSMAQKLMAEPTSNISHESASLLNDPRISEWFRKEHTNKGGKKSRRNKK